MVGLEWYPCFRLQPSTRIPLPQILTTFWFSEEVLLKFPSRKFCKIPSVGTSPTQADKQAEGRKTKLTEAFSYLRERA